MFLAQFFTQDYAMFQYIPRRFSLRYTIQTLRPSVLLCNSTTQRLAYAYVRPEQTLSRT
jgi:hypothetical protein